MSYTPPPPSDGPNPYGDIPEVAGNQPDATGPQDQPPPPTGPSYGTPPPPPPPSSPGQTYGTPGQTYGNPGQTYGNPGQTYGGPSASSPYLAGRPPGAPGYAGFAVSRDNGKGTGALVLGIMSILFCFGSFVAVAMGVIAIVLGVQGRAACDRGSADNRGIATAGMVLGIIGGVLGIITSLGYLSSLLVI